MTSVINRLSFLFCLLFIVGCGNRPAIIENLTVTPDFSGGEANVRVETDFNVGGMELMYLTLPINHPQTGEQIGQFAMAGKRLSLGINLSAIAHLNSGPAQLPNGTGVPFAGTNEIVVVPIGGQGIRLYVSWTQTKVLLGVAVPIKQFDVIGQTVGQVNLLPIFQIGQVQGAAGTFHSRTAGQNGIAFFADISVALPQAVKEELFYQTEGAYLSQESFSKVSIRESVPRSSTEAEIGSQIQKLSRRKVKLSVR
ncbi:MAG: hypothetical protein JNM93_06950 [Bacteriovoracaceae bacterium]|nr:hypothetical protein [Bacteriovoracaceae bacterium]